MDIFFRKTGIMNFDISYPANKEKQTIRKILKNLLMSLVYLHEKFDIEFVSSKKIIFKHNLFKVKSASLSNSSLPILFCAQGEFSVEKKHNGNLSIKYDLNNTVFILPIAIITIIVALFFLLIVLQNPMKASIIITAFFMFETFIWGVAILICKIFPYFVFTKKIKKVINNI